MGQLRTLSIYLYHRNSKNSDRTGYDETMLIWALRYKDAVKPTCFFTQQLNLSTHIYDLRQSLIEARMLEIQDDGVMYFPE